MTIKALYQQLTGDTAAHHSAIGARLKRMSDQRQRIAHARAKGQSWKKIAAQEGIKFGAAATILRNTMAAIHKDITGMPRYHSSGRSPAAPRNQLRR